MDGVVLIMSVCPITQKRGRHVRIRKEILASFQRAMNREFEMRLVRFLQGAFPNATSEVDTTLAEGIREQLAKARGYGLLTEQQIATYVTSAWLLGTDFDRQFPAVQEVLASHAPPNDKGDWLERFTKDLFEQMGRRS
jgi:hypothetical protein